MEIKKSSWHYRFLNYFSEYGPPTNLCGYFWKLVLGVILAMIVSVIIIFVLGSMFIGMFFPKTVFFDSGLVFWAAVIIMFSFHLLDEWKLRRERKTTLIGSYWRAFKGKYCPKITFKD